MQINDQTNGKPDSWSQELPVDHMVVLKMKKIITQNANTLPGMSVEAT